MGQPCSIRVRMAPWCRWLVVNGLQSKRNDEECDLSEKRDVVADAIEPGVGVANGNVHLEAGIECADRLARKYIDAGGEMMWPPGVHGETGIVRFVLVEDRA